MSPQEFAEKMAAIFHPDYDEEHAHAEADSLMCSQLRELGFSAGVEIFEKAGKWYA